VTTTGRGAPYDAELMAAVAELGGSMRELVEASVATTVGVRDLQLAADEVRAVTERLAASRRPATQLPSLDDPVTFRRVYSPVTGVGSPLAPPLVIRAADDGVVAEAALGLRYEGPPGFVHGGVSGLLMDQMLGAATIAAGLWGMTVHLELDYRGPLPLQTPLVLRARVAKDAGRKTLVEGGIALASAPEQPLVEARGIFVVPRSDRLEAYFGAITDAAGRPRPPGRPTDATALERN
jgi:acyl-coenzyme A thioesterase PaaI-like protein